MSVARHTLYNAIGAIAPLAVSLLTVPAYLAVIGPERYGVLGLCWILAGYFALADFGIGRAVSQRIARASGSDQHGERSRIFWTGLSLSLIMSIAAVGLLLPFGSTFIRWMHISNHTVELEALAAVSLIVASIPLSIIQNLMKGCLDGRHQFLASNLILSSGAALTAILPLVSAWIFGPNLIYLVIATLIARAVIIMALSLSTARAIPLGRLERPHRGDYQGLMKFGFWLTISNVLSPVMTFIDRFLIGAMIGAAAAALYIIPYNLVSQLVVIPTAFAAALFPTLAAKSRDQARRETDMFIGALSYLLWPVTFGAIILMEPFLRAWIGMESASTSAPAALVLLLGFWINSLAQMPFTRLHAGGQPDVIAKIHLLEFVPYILLLILALKSFGLVGAAIAWSLRCTFDFCALAVADRVSRTTLKHVFWQSSLLLATAFTIGFTDNWGVMRLLTLVLLLIVLIVSIRQYAPPSLWTIMNQFLDSQIRSRGKGKA